MSNQYLFVSEQYLLNIMSNLNVLCRNIMHLCLINMLCVEPICIYVTSICICTQTFCIYGTSISTFAETCNYVKSIFVCIEPICIYININMWLCLKKICYLTHQYELGSEHYEFILNPYVFV